MLPAVFREKQPVRPEEAACLQPRVSIYRPNGTRICESPRNPAVCVSVPPSPHLQGGRLWDQNVWESTGSFSKPVPGSRLSWHHWHPISWRRGCLLHVVIGVCPRGEDEDMGERAGGLQGTEGTGVLRAKRPSEQNAAASWAAKTENGSGIHQGFGRFHPKCWKEVVKT